MPYNDFFAWILRFELRPAVLETVMLPLTPYPRFGGGDQNRTDLLWFFRPALERYSATPPYFQHCKDNIFILPGKQKSPDF